jgi:hypothetical protein
MDRRSSADTVAAIGVDTLMKQTHVSGLVGMVVGGGLLARQMSDPGFSWQSDRITLPIILMCLGVLYFLFGDYISKANKKKDD